MRHAVVYLLALSLVLSAAPSPAHQGPGEMGMMGGMSPGRGPGHEGPLISLMLDMKDQLGLSLQQVQTLRDLRADFEKEAIQREAEIRVAEVELREILVHERVDLGRAETLVRKIAGLRAELRLARLRTLEKGKAILTPEQLAKFREEGHRMARRGMDDGGMMGGPGGMRGGQVGPGMMGPGGTGGMGERPRQQ